MASLVGYVVGTQMPKTVKVRVPYEVFLPKYQKNILRHRNFLAHDETGQCMVGDVIRIVSSVRFSQNKRHCVAGFVKKAERYVDKDTHYVYTNGHLRIPVGYQDPSTGTIENRFTHAQYREMGLL